MENSYNNQSYNFSSQSSHQINLENDSNDFNNNNVQIPQDEFDDIILSLEFTVNNLNKDQNKYFIMEELENIIEKLKKYAINIKKSNNKNNKKEPQILKSNSTNIPTIEINPTIHAKNNYSPLKLQNPNNQYSNSFSEINNIKKITNYNTKTHKNVKSSSNLTMNVKVPVRNERSPPQTRYNGQRINGKKEGMGVYIYPNGCKYEGYFKNDKKEGHGIFYYKNGDRYEGNFEDGNYEGNGIFYFSNGDRYEGQFKKNKYSGRGKYYYHNGDSFDGFWTDDKKNGEGIYYYGNGDRTVGNYYNGKPYGTHIRYCIDGRNFQINY